MNADLPLDENEKKRLVLKLISQLQCLECGRAYNRDDFALVHRWEDVWVLSTHCHHCKSRSHIVVMMHAHAEPAPATDLTLGELKVAADLPPISADDVLDVHVFLREFDGDFEELFPR